MFSQCLVTESCSVAVPCVTLSMKTSLFFHLESCFALCTVACNQIVNSRNCTKSNLLLRRNLFYFLKSVITLDSLWIKHSQSDKVALTFLPLRSGSVYPAYCRVFDLRNDRNTKVAVSIESFTMIVRKEGNESIYLLSVDSLESFSVTKACVKNNITSLLHS